MKFTVFACCLTSETSAVAVGLRKIGSRTSRMHVIQMDVTSQKDVDRARKIVEDRLPKKGLWGIVNNASCYRLGFLEWLPLETYESVYIAIGVDITVMVNFSFHFSLSSSHRLMYAVSCV
jgi:3-hydroxybutyrate dehydrogenase